MTIDFDALGLEILAEVSKTNMSEVYRARQVSIDRTVCLKLATGSATATTRQRFQREAQIMTSLQHPNIANTYQFGFVDGRPYLLLEWLEGEPLSSLLARTNLSSEQACEIFAELASAIQFAHTRGIIHRDLKPSNVFLLSQGSETIVKVIDFGISKQESNDNPESGRLTQTGALLGSPAYMSPEQCNSEPATAASDQYALACVLYEMVTGKRVFEATSDFELLLCHAQQTPAVSGVSAGLKNVLLRALQKNPKDRFSSVADFWKAAEPMVLDNDVQQKEIKPLTLCLLALILITVAGFAWHYQRKQQTTAEQQSLTNRTPLWADKTFDNLEEHLNRMIANNEYVAARKEAAEAISTRAKMVPRQQITLSCIYLRTYFMNNGQRHKVPVADQKQCEHFVEVIHSLLDKEERNVRTNALMNLGQWRSYNGDLEGAAKYFRQAISENVKHIEGQYDRYWNDRATYRRCLAEVLEEQRRYQDALKQRQLLQKDRAKGAEELWYIKPIADLELACDLYRTGKQQEADALVSTVNNEYALPKPENWTAESVEKRLFLYQYFDTYYQLSAKADRHQKLVEEKLLLVQWQTAHR